MRYDEPPPTILELLLRLVALVAVLACGCFAVLTIAWSGADDGRSDRYFVATAACLVGFLVARWAAESLEDEGFTR